MMLACEFLVVSGVHRECFHLFPDCPMYSNRFPHPFTHDEKETASKLLLSTSCLGGVKGNSGALSCLPSVATINTRTESNLGEEKGWFGL